MAIRSNVEAAPQTIGTIDTNIFSVSAPITRANLTKLWVYNTSTTERAEVRFYVSPNNTSASGTYIDRVILASEMGAPCNGLIGYSVPQGLNVIAVADVTGVECLISSTEYDEES